jgi:hypothetical protein
MSLEDLKQNKYVQQYAHLTPGQVALSPFIQVYSDVCKMICEGGEQA